MSIYCHYLHVRPTVVGMLTPSQMRVVRLHAMLDSGDAQRLIERAGLSYRQIGKAVGCDASAVWRWHKGERRPTATHALRYLTVLEQVAIAQQQTGGFPT